MEEKKATVMPQVAPTAVQKVAPPTSANAGNAFNLGRAAVMSNAAIAEQPNFDKAVFPDHPVSFAAVNEDDTKDTEPSHMGIKRGPNMAEEVTLAMVWASLMSWIFGCAGWVSS